MVHRTGDIGSTGPALTAALHVAAVEPFSVLAVGSISMIDEFANEY